MISDSTMLSWWRKAVRKIHGEMCVWPGCTEVGAEIHHVVKRRRTLTRYDAKNGLPLCHAHHNIADTIEGREILNQYVDIEYLKDLERHDFKQWLAVRSMSRAEFLEEELAELKRIVKEER